MYVSFVVCQYHYVLFGSYVSATHLSNASPISFIMHYTVSQKTRYLALAHINFKYLSIFKKFSVTDSVVNLQQDCV